MSAFADLIQNLKSSRALTAEDALAMRRVVWTDGRISADEADAIMALNTACAAPSIEWLSFFIEAMTDYIVRQETPTGHVDDRKARWLMAHIDQDGKVCALSELELLIRVLEVADRVPEALKPYVLQQIETAVLTGVGPTRLGPALLGPTDLGALEAGRINATEVDMLRRVIFAPSSDGSIGVSAAEADLLFRLKDATLGADNASSWADMFVKGVANHLMAHSSYDALSRGEQAQMDAFVANTEVKVGRFFGRVFGKRTTVMPDRILEAAKTPGAEVAKDMAVTASEWSWLQARIDADAATDDLERALLKFLAAG